MNNIKIPIDIVFLFSSPLIDEDGIAVVPVEFRNEIKKIIDHVKKESNIMIKPIDENSLKETIDMGPPIIHISCHGERNFL